MLPDLLSKLLTIDKRPWAADNNIFNPSGETGTDNSTVLPDKMMQDKAYKGIMDDDGYFSLDQNPFAGLKDAITKSRSGDNSGPGVLRQLLGSLLQGKIVPNTGTVGGDPAGIGTDTHTPGTRQDAALNPTPMKDQSQFNMQPVAPRMDYSQPSALDPVAIEQLRQSLLTDAGQLDPNNPNGLAGRMSDPNSQVDMNNQRKESMDIEDSVRGFDGSRKANIQKGNQ